MTDALVIFAITTFLQVFKRGYNSDPDNAIFKQAEIRGGVYDYNKVQELVTGNWPGGDAIIEGYFQYGTTGQLLADAAIVLGCFAVFAIVYTVMKKRRNRVD